MMHGVIGRAGFGIATITASRFGACHLLGVGRFDLGKLDRVGADTEKVGFLLWKAFPHDVLRDGYPACAMRCAIGQWCFDTFEECLDVVGGTLTLTHGHDDGGTAKGAVTGGEHFRVRGAHAVVVSGNAVYIHEAEGFELVTFGLLADRGNNHPAGDVVLGAGNRDWTTSAVLVGLAQLSFDTCQL